MKLYGPISKVFEHGQNITYVRPESICAVTVTRVSRDQYRVTLYTTGVREYELRPDPEKDFYSSEEEVLLAVERFFQGD